MIRCSQVQISKDTSIEEQAPATATETVDPWDAVLIDTEDSEEDASEKSILPVRKQVTEYIKDLKSAYPGVQTHSLTFGLIIIPGSV